MTVTRGRMLPKPLRRIARRSTMAIDPDAIVPEILARDRAVLGELGPDRARRFFEARAEMREHEWRREILATIGADVGLSEGDAILAAREWLGRKLQYEDGSSIDFHELRDESLRAEVENVYHWHASRAWRSDGSRQIVAAEGRTWNV